jgi:UDP-N-acetylglucosamine transferase subunit ALG13
VQAGPCTVPLAHAEGRAWFTPAELDGLADEARLIVAHGGPGSLFLAWDRGRTPVVVPRRPELGEHVDDHQVRFASGLGDRAVVVDDPATLAEVIRSRAAVLSMRRAPSPDRGEPFLHAFAGLVDDLVQRRRARPGLRGRLRHLLSSLGSPRR